MNQVDLQKVEERLYIIRWTFNGPKEDDKRVDTFTWKDRQEALKRYIDLQEKWYASDIRFQVAQPQDVNVDQFLNSF